jgi:hypothetical protein
VFRGVLAIVIDVRSGAVVMRGRPVVMIRMIVTCVLMDVERRRRDREQDDGGSERKRDQAAHA